MKIIGLTGGIASGKTRVSNILKKLGAIILDADKIAREVVKKGQPAYQDIIAYFGKEILLGDGEIDRGKLATLVFNNPAAMDKLNHFTHPRIFEKIDKEIKTYKQICKKDVIIIDAALLIETDLKNMVEEIWLVSVPEKIQKNRLMDRDKISSTEADKRIKAQMPLEEKISFADRVIDNSGNVEELTAQVKKIWELIIEK